jgi:hypothetical protein
MSTLLNLNQFAFKLGETDRLTLNASLTFHTHYAKSSADNRKAQRIDFISGYVQGRLDVTTTEAVRIIELKRTERDVIQERAVNAAGKMFKYHVVRDIEESSSKKEQVVAPKGLVKKITADIIDAGLTKAEFDALLSALRDSVSFQ